MADYGIDNPNYAAEQMPPTSPGAQLNPHRFDQYIMPNVSTSKPVTLQGGVSEYGARTQLQNGVTDNTTRTGVPLQGNVQDGRLRAGVSDSGGIPTNCLRIEDADERLDRPVYATSPKHIYHNVFIKESDKVIVQRAKAQGTFEIINLYDDTGHIINPVYAAAVGGLFTVGYKQSSVVLNLFESPNPNRRAAGIPEELKQKVNKYKPLLQKALKYIH